MKYTQWTKRKFWDGTEAVFLKNNNTMSCYDLDSDELGDIIVNRKNELNALMNEWRDLQDMREKYINSIKETK
tara:strand:+ start:3791 stop:4009 length:219 start_codon:yes stop_codon:yes gene_type:complete